MRKKILIIVPAFNEGKIIGETVRGVVEATHGKVDVLVVDDGSNDNTSDEALKAGSEVISHPINRGLGGALGTGLYWAKIHNVDYCVTFDADGQHDPNDLEKILNPILTGKADVVIGSRTINGWKQLPNDRRVLMMASNILTWFLFGIKTTDSLSGFRAFNRRAIERIRVLTDRMEVSNEFFCEIKRNKLRFQEVPIKVIYSDYSRAKGQKNSNAFDVGVKLLLRLFQ